MRAEYDFSQGIPNPYAKKLQKTVSVKVDANTLDYFKTQAEQSGIGYQVLMNLYLVDCAVHAKKLHMAWT
jgi:uncharacterized protein (DUF4415 family)